MSTAIKNGKADTTNQAENAKDGGMRFDDLSRQVELKLSEAEIMVLTARLDELISAAASAGQLDAAEEQALWNLSCVIEKSNDYTFAANFDEILEAAKLEITRS